MERMFKHPFQPNQNQRKRIGDYFVDPSRVLGSGAFGTVMECYRYSQNRREVYACKKQIYQTEDEYSEIEYESMILKLFDHPNIIKLFDAYEDDGAVYQIFELCNCGDLSTLVDAQKMLKEEDALLILKQIFEGLKEVQKMKVVHRDLKPQNLFLHFPQIPLKCFSELQKLQFLKNVSLSEVEFQVKIADMGHAERVRSFDQKLKQICGSPLFMAPQIIQASEYTHKVDIWSLGATYYYLVTGQYPFFGKNIDDLRRNILKGTYVIPKTIELSIQGISFLSQCLLQEESKRPSFEELLQHPYFTEQDIFRMKAVHNSEFQNKVRLQMKRRDHRMDSKRATKEYHEYNRHDKVFYLSTKDTSLFEKIYEHTKQVYEEVKEEIKREEEELKSQSSIFLVQNERKEETMNRRAYIAEIIIEIENPLSEFLNTITYIPPQECASNINLKKSQRNVQSLILQPTFSPQSIGNMMESIYLEQSEDNLVQILQKQKTFETDSSIALLMIEESLKENEELKEGSSEKKRRSAIFMKAMNDVYSSRLISQGSNGIVPTSGSTVSQDQSRLSDQENHYGMDSLLKRGRSLFEFIEKDESKSFNQPSYVVETNLQEFDLEQDHF